MPHAPPPRPAGASSSTPSTPRATASASITAAMADIAADYTASYAAFFAPRTHKFETIDFRVPASVANLRSYFPRTEPQRARQLHLAALLGLAIGLVVAIVGLAVDQLTRGLTIAVYRATETLLDTDRHAPAIVVFVIICVLYVLIAAVLVVFVAPLGAGSGIPELKSYLNGVKVPGFLALNSLFVKSIGVAFTIAGGLICGKQGPMIHAGAIVGAGMSQAATSRLKFRLRSPLFRFLRTEAWKRDFAAVGAAVGVAVAFGSPMGAWMWVYEEACTHWTWQIGMITLGGCLTGAGVVRIFNYLATGLPGGFGAFSVTSFGKLFTDVEGFSFPLKDLPAYMLLGVIGGIAGAILPLVNKHITLLRYRSITTPRSRLIEAAIIGFLTAIVRIIIPYLVDDCRPADAQVQAALAGATLGDYSRFTCAAGEYSAWAAVMYNPTDTVVRALLFSPDVFLPAGAVAVALVYYYIFIVWTYGIAVPAGIFFPGFVLGSVYGRLVGIAVEAIFPDRTDVSLTGFAFLGAVSALAGITRTISVAVIAIEATGGSNASYASALVAVIAKIVSDFLYNRGIYDLHIDLKGIPFLLSSVPNVETYHRVRVSQVMESSVIGVRRLSKVDGLIRMLATNDHHGFPVFVRLTAGQTDLQAAHGLSLDALSPDQDDSSADDIRGSISESSLLEAQLVRDEAPSFPRLKVSSSIITPGHHGLRATIFETGNTQLVHLTERGSVEVLANTKPDYSTGRVPQSPNASSLSTKDSDKTPASLPEIEIPDFELMGMIDRGTLLALLKYECDKADARRNSDDESVPDEVPREELDAAWPNPGRLKGKGEELLIQRVKDLRVTEKVIDLKQYIDPDPLLMSDRALSASAYKLLRRTGARHILVTNMRSGRVSGIMTRKDILPESLDEVDRMYKEVKVE